MQVTPDRRMSKAFLFNVRRELAQHIFKDHALPMMAESSLYLACLLPSMGKIIRRQDFAKLTKAGLRLSTHTSELYKSIARCNAII